MAFRYRKAIRVSYQRQGYIYFASKRFGELTEGQQKKIIDHCKRIGGEDYWEALFAFMTREIGLQTACRRFYVSESTLKRKIRRYYEEFPESL